MIWRILKFLSDGDRSAVQEQAVPKAFNEAVARETAADCPDGARPSITRKRPPVIRTGGLAVWVQAGGGWGGGTTSTNSSGTSRRRATSRALRRTSNPMVQRHLAGAAIRAGQAGGFDSGQGVLGPGQVAVAVRVHVGPHERGDFHAGGALVEAASGTGCSTRPGRVSFLRRASGRIFSCSVKSRGPPSRPGRPPVSSKEENPGTAAWMFGFSIAHFKRGGHVDGLRDDLRSQKTPAWVFMARIPMPAFAARSTAAWTSARCGWRKL